MKFFKSALLFLSFLVASVSYAQNPTQFNSQGNITGTAASCDLLNSSGCVVLPLPFANISSTVITVSGIWTGTLNFIATNDGLPFSSALSMIPVGGGSAVTDTTGDGSWYQRIPGETVVGVYASAMSGTATVTITSSTAAISGGTLTFENAGTPIGTGTVFNCSTNTTCTNTAGVITLTATNTGSTAFSALTSATNSTATMVVGSGASLVPTSSSAGVLTANGLMFGTTTISDTSTAPTSGQCLEYNGTGITGAACSGGGGSPGGSNTYVQFNSMGSFGGSANLTWVSPTLTIGASGTAGSLAEYNNTATTTWGSAATTSNTILGFATVPTTGDLVDCVVSSTTCTLTDSGVLAANVTTNSSNYPSNSVTYATGNHTQAGSANLTWSSPTLTVGSSGTAGSIAEYNNTATTTWGSAATTSNTILGFAIAPTSGDLVDCVVSSTTCTLTDAGGPIPASLANASHEWLNSYTKSTGVFTQTRPADTDLSGTTAGAELYITSSAVAELATTAYSAKVSGATNPSWATPTANGQCFMSGASNYATTTPSFQSCPSAGTALSSITAATGANTIASGNHYGQIWNWALTSNGVTAFTFGETSAATGSGTNYILEAETAAGSTASPFNVTNSLTGSQTLCTICITPTWDTTGVVDAGIFENVTNTASGSGSLLLDLQVGGTSQFGVDKAGNVNTLGTISTTSDGTHAAGAFLVGNTTAPTIPSNSFGIIGPDSASFTTYVWQPSATAPSATGPILVSAVSSSVSAVSYGTLSGTGTVFPTTVSPTFTTPALGAATATSLLASGIVDGEAPITITTGSSANLGGTYLSGYTLNQEGTAATGVTYTLPATAAGKQYCVQNSGTTSVVNTGVLTVYPPSGSYVILNGVVNTVGGGGTHGVASGGAAGDGACFVGIDSTHWEVFPTQGTWTEN